MPRMDATEPRPSLAQQIGNPWLFIPLLYFMQAIPVHIVQDVSVLVYKDILSGDETVKNVLITRWTSLIALPWSMQFLLGPLVDFNFTKRRWILGGQAVICVGLIIAAFTLGLPNAFNVSLAILGVTAIASALCNIATDGFYILSQTKENQTKFAGVQTTFYRLGRLFCTWLIVRLAGEWIKQGQAPAKAWTIFLVAASVLYFIGFLINTRSVPKPDFDAPKPQVEEDQNRKNLIRTLLIATSGLSLYFALNAVTRLIAHGLWSSLGADPDGKWKGWMLSVPKPPATLRWGPIDSPFTPIISEAVQFFVCAGIFLAAFSAARRMVVNTEMGYALSSFFRQPGIVAILIFVLFYRFPEAMVGKMTALFYKDPLDKGGLALSTATVGDIKGLVSVLGIIAGGIVGGYVVHKLGLKRAFWLVAIAMHLPNLLYLWATYNAPTLANYDASKWTLWGIEAVDQMGYGIGYAAYFVFLMQVAQRGNHITTHYAIASGLGATCIALAGILGGILQSNFGWHGLFISVIFLGIPALATLLIIPLDPPKGQSGAAAPT